MPEIRYMVNTNLFYSMTQNTSVIPPCFKLLLALKKVVVNKCLNGTTDV